MGEQGDFRGPAVLGVMRTSATSMPSAEVPLMMPATIMVLMRILCGLVSFSRLISGSGHVSRERLQLDAQLLDLCR